jgi:mRNA interferase HigB
VRIIKPSTLRAYAKANPTARIALSAWLVTVSRASWTSLASVRKTYPHADAAIAKSGRVVTIFNICGNKFRLVVAIHYNTQRVYIREFMTHAQYSSQAWKGRN